MPETTYTAVVWTAGDIITEAKMDNMTANDRAVDAMNNGIRLDERADPSTPPANTLHVYAKDKDGVSALYMIDDSGVVIQLGDVTPTFVFTITGTVVTGTSLTPALIVPKALTITKAYIYAKTVNTGADLIIDINKNGSTIWATQSNRITLPASDADGQASQTSFDTTSITEGDILTVDVDQIGSTIAGQDITIALKTK